MMFPITVAKDCKNKVVVHFSIMLQRRRVSITNGRTANVDRVRVCHDWRLSAVGEFHDNTAKHSVGWILLRILILTSRIQISAQGLVTWGFRRFRKTAKSDY